VEMEAERGDSLRIVTWNLWWRFGPDWRRRQPGILQTLRSIDPDIVATQETWGDARTTQAHDLAEKLGFHAAYAAPSLPPTPPEPESADQLGTTLGLGLVSRWPTTSARAVPTPTRHRAEASVALVATIAHPAGPLPVVVACLEYESAYDDDRTAQARAVLDLATDPVLDGRLPVILAGDLNAPIESPILRPLRDALIDTWTAGHGDPHAVTTPATHAHPAELVDRRIDHVFLRPGRPGQVVTVHRARVLDPVVDGVAPSDHRPVVVDVSWTGRR
jgi:endonuclease/exonuclease/phosphatase family metal-dependent hydrolase